MRKRDIERKQRLTHYLKRFRENPHAVMDEIPKKTRVGVQVSDEAKASRSYMDYKDALRKKLCMKKEDQVYCLDQPKGKVPFSEEDMARDLVDNPDKMIESLSVMDRKKLYAATLSETPWSDDYWAFAKGGIAYRYNYKKMKIKDKKKTWKELYDIFLNNPPESLSSVKKLSPAEKYDLLMADENYTLTNAMWAQGEFYYNQSGKVESWMGICNGWAQAAYSYPRPEKSVTLVNKNGVKIKFLPSDIKALGSLLSANSKSNVRFVGNRCNDKSPKKDKRSGRVLSPECFDTNPGTWHLATVHQIGVENRSFIMDNTYDYEVWNQPVYSYDYIYFNVKNFLSDDDSRGLESYLNWKKARVSAEEFEEFDIFRDVRQKKEETKYIVGVSMIVHYVVEVSPTSKTTSSLQDDALSAVEYVYDLEVDKEGNILGGEWYSNMHPDFLWTVAKGSKPLYLPTSRSQRFYEKAFKKSITPSGKVHLSASLKRAVVNELSPYGTPLGALVDYLFEASSKKTKK